MRRSGPSMGGVRGGIVALLALSAACQTTPKKPERPVNAVAVEDDARRVRVTPPGALISEPPAEADHALFFTDRARDMGLAVVIDEPPNDLPTLTENVLRNARAGVENMRVLHNTDALLGGLPAHRVEFVFDLPGGGSGYFINIHTATQTNNVQVAVWGDEKVRDVIRSAADAMEGDAFAFTAAVTPFRPAEPAVVVVDWAELPLVVEPSVLASWRPLPAGQLNTAAFLELAHSERGLWFLAIEANVADLNGLTFEELARKMHTQMALDMEPLPPTNLGVFDEVGDDVDRRWSLTGVFTEGKTPLLHRFRLVMTNERVLQMYCWGNATDNVTAACNALYNAVSPRPPLTSAPPALTPGAPSTNEE